MIQVNYQPLDKDIERRRALAKIYSLLIKLADETEDVPLKVNQEESNELLKINIPTGQ